MAIHLIAVESKITQKQHVKLLVMLNIKVS